MYDILKYFYRYTSVWNIFLFVCVVFRKMQHTCQIYDLNMNELISPQGGNQLR
jgi:hypothetical protein